MSDDNTNNNSVSGRLASLAQHVVPDSAAAQKEWKNLPSYKDLPHKDGYPGCAWGVWGDGDELGTVNLLTPSVVKQAAQEEIKTGHAISLNWPLHLPLKPMFRRRHAEHKVIGKGGGRYIQVREAQREKGKKVVVELAHPDFSEAPLNDEELHVNSQSGTQWDGLRHFGHLPLNCFYNGVTRKDIPTGPQKHPHDPSLHASTPYASSIRNGIQAWAQHGIVGRGVLLDVWGYLIKKESVDKEKGPYDPCTSHPLSVALLKEVAQAQGVTFRQGDILMIRGGFIRRYYNSTEVERDTWGAGGNEKLAGVEQGEEMKAFLWDNHFAAVAGDAPAFERWPPPKGEQHLHETLLALWGCPIGEMFDSKPSQPIAPPRAATPSSSPPGRSTSTAASRALPTPAPSSELPSDPPASESTPRSPARAWPLARAPN